MKKATFVRLESAMTQGKVKKALKICALLNLTVDSCEEIYWITTGIKREIQRG